MDPAQPGLCRELHLACRRAGNTHTLALDRGQERVSVKIPCKTRKRYHVLRLDHNRRSNCIGHVDCIRDTTAAQLVASIDEFANGKPLGYAVVDIREYSALFLGVGQTLPLPLGNHG